MRSEGYGKLGLSVCVCVCVSVQHLTSGASVRPENAVTYSACNEGEKNCGIFFETPPLQRSSTSGIFRYAESAHALVLEAWPCETSKHTRRGFAL